MIKTPKEGLWILENALMALKSRIDTLRQDPEKNGVPLNKLLELLDQEAENNLSTKIANIVGMMLVLNLSIKERTKLLQKTGPTGKWFDCQA